jgi:hypothetical protein
VYDQVQYNMFCQGNMCADPNLQYVQETVFYNATDKVLINYYCIDISVFIQSRLPDIIKNLPIPIPQWIIDFIMSQVNVVHISWMEVMSGARTLNLD